MIKLFGLSFIISFHISCALEWETEREMHIPQINGDWWQVAGDPDLEEYVSPKQRPIDFEHWVAAVGITYRSKKGVVS